MRTKLLYLIILLLLVSCAPGTSLPAIPTAESILVEKEPEQTKTSTASPQQLYLQETTPQGNIEDAKNWQMSFQSIMGKDYLYSNDDVSPNGRWLLKIESDFRHTSEMTVRLYSLRNSNSQIEYHYDQKGTIDFWAGSWSPDGNSFVGCGIYNPETATGDAGCDYMVIFDIVGRNELRAYPISWASVQSPIIEWYSYSDKVAFISYQSGIWLFNKQGSLINHTSLKHLCSSASSYNSSHGFTATDDQLDPVTQNRLPTNLYTIDLVTSDWEIEYTSIKPFFIIGSDSMGNLMLEEYPIYGNNRVLEQKPILDIYNYGKTTITTQFIIPDGWDILGTSQSVNYFAINLKPLAGNSNIDKIWIYDWENQQMKFYGDGTLLGWFPPANGFLVSDQNGDWLTIKP